MSRTAPGSANVKRGKGGGRRGSALAKPSKKLKKEKTYLSLKDKLVQIAGEIGTAAEDRKQGFDKPLFCIVIGLLVIGLVMMYSASYAYAYQYYEGQSNYFILRQLVFAVIGVAAMLLVSFYPAKRIKSLTFPLYIVSFILLILVMLLPRIEGVHRWINLGFTTFQPSEITKFAVILFCATWAEVHADKMDTAKWGFWPFAFAVGPVALLVLIEPHISCTVLIALITLTIMFVGGAKLIWFAIAGGISTAILIAVSLTGILAAYSEDRVKVWLDPFSDQFGKGWQNIQALYAISSGGLLGVGLGNSRQKYLYISEPQNDFVFAVICEELGFVGAVLIILLFMAFVWRGLSISVANPNRFSKLLGIGITSQVGWQVILNIAVVTKTIPNTGISLPFFSYGGTSLVMLLAEMGVLLAISRNSLIKRI